MNEPTKNNYNYIHISYQQLSSIWNSIVEILA